MAVPLAAIVGTTALLVALDPHEGGYFRQTPSFHRFGRVFSSNNATIGTALAPASLLIAGMCLKDSKMEGTALFAAEAYVNTFLVTAVMKNITRRVRPIDLPPHANFSDTWFQSEGKGLRGGGFPSGHTSAAFAVATVISRRYPKQRWLPFAAYGLAGLFAFSRVSLSQHFVSDVFMGAALGYSVSRYTVLRHR